MPDVISKTDYAANGGTHIFTGFGPGVSSNCYSTYPACQWSNSNASAFDGISGERSQVTPGLITNGQSNVFLAGEKFLDPGQYNTGADGGDNSTALAGNGQNTDRWTSNILQRDATGLSTPSVGASWFGSAAHSQGCHFVFCDGSVKLINYSINATTYLNLGSRNSGNVSESY